jgi:hypothetical protein
VVVVLMVAHRLVGDWIVMVVVVSLEPLMEEVVIGGHYQYRMEPQLSHRVVMAILVHRHHTQFSSEAHDHHHVGLDHALAFCSVVSSPAQPHYHHHLF